MLVRNGVTYPVLAAALKRVFLDAARRELADRGMAATDSAVTLRTINDTIVVPKVDIEERQLSSQSVVCPVTQGWSPGIPSSGTPSSSSSGSPSSQAPSPSVSSPSFAGSTSGCRSSR